ncbi:helix-turn-helix domain-containing protein [Natronococcus sp. A-GB7]|uniref:helix-turn-helix domain-containing protein n=1 Tax=Natronococcus sp. A-GB7 TaxID=3037649 RepID=UPI00241F8CF6|nr:helix-turn-helix domain-containing protein [Natronococcus sp. A-GB7]MDG5820357.1 helix-turn-helix domain-containing protein [Natronococcus sp. A-GB7]
MQLETRPDVSIPGSLESAQAKLLYLYLREWPDASADELCAALDVEKGTVLSIARTLRERGYVERDGGRYRLA